mmetsp:Transcript_23611/g.3917  ORF Transcript_23611/g.3917 Transcript_23611/m.3917 type:complete len:101 (+) Transcript_23611:365-667(+)|eukprot:CAMPEP_0168315152 /NCGR_PEP_ID=MMETSP0210-20121227/10306_1 /TAXON_ID=40633 /ORGANISM="Condylostoma magnum, Strain COL2" /LENGTH=100 /DNA_ID=CAMNT_0008286725 /DNA_START=369 /DNA_END=671 /DNA_ORIENTATION=-
MTDDGTAGNIEIPVVMIDKQSSDLVYEYLRDSEKAKTVSVSIRFEMNHPDNRVEYEIWYSPDHIDTLKFLAEFSPLGRRFDDTKALFTPHFALWYCTECK